MKEHLFQHKFYAIQKAETFRKPGEKNRTEVVPLEKQKDREREERITYAPSAGYRNV
jgi:hypothetical protein